MGTRHLICVVANKEYKVAQYGQWDGYPSGQGVEVLNFLTDPNFNKDIFRRQCLNIEHITAEEIDNRAKAFNDDDDFLTNHPEFSRNTSTGILQIIVDADGQLDLFNDIEFASDGLFCEWCYVIDLDTNKLEVYGGFGETALSENDRFFNTKSESKYNIKMITEYDLDNLPSKSQFLKELEPDADADEISKEPLTAENISKAIHNIRVVSFENQSTVDSLVNYLDANIDDILQALNKK